MRQHTTTGLFTDLYEFTMAQSQLENGMTGEAVFDLHARRLPPGRGYLVAAGLETLMDRLERFRFTDQDLDFLADQGLGEELLDYLSDYRFEGEVRAIPEGRLAFPYEPLVQVRAPLPMAQLIETVVLNTIHLETLLATKAARCIAAVGGPGEGTPDLVDFGARRAHGPDAARAAARSAALAGFAGTSLVELARDLGIPCVGTMAHSFVQAFPTERAAMETFARSFPHGTTLLIDTYDTIQGARTAVAVARDLASEGIRIGGVRIDSGDLADLSTRVRTLLDDAGLEEVRILASGGLNERRLAALVEQGAPIDGFGVGTALVVSADAPTFDLSYKLAAYDGQPVMKTSPRKHTLPGAKQVFRRIGEEGALVGDMLGLEDEVLKGEPLLQPVTQRKGAQALEEARRRFEEEFPRLPGAYRGLEDPPPYPVERSPALERLTEETLARARKRSP